jgi:hypothetical protein
MNSPDVIGADLAPMPTQEDFKRAYKAAYVARFVEMGIPADLAEQDFDGCDFEDIKDTPPANAADESLEYWGDDGDGPS